MFKVLIENIDKTKRYTFRVTGRNESGAGEAAIVELTEPLYKKPSKVEKTEEVKTKEEVLVKKEIITEEVTEVTEKGQQCNTTAVLIAFQSFVSLLKHPASVIDHFVCVTQVVVLYRYD